MSYIQLIEKDIKKICHNYLFSTIVIYPINKKEKKNKYVTTI